MTTSFSERCVEAARAFVRTAAVIDDFPEYAMQESDVAVAEVKLPSGAERPRIAEPPVEAAKDPLPRQDGSAETGVPRIADTSPGLEAPSEGRDHQLRTREIVEAFANSGVVCSVMVSGKFTSEEHKEGWKARALRLAEVVDVLISDWSWNGDAGDFCVSVIGQLLKRSPDRRQLVVVYTAGDDRDAIAVRLSALGFGPVRLDPGTIRFSNGLDVVILQKPKAPKPFDAESRVSERDLPDRVLREFGRLSGGVLANVAMHALGAIRDRSHRLLREFEPTLDSAYVVHRALTVPRSGAEDQVVDVLTDAVAGVVAEAALWKHVDDDAIAEWVDRPAGAEALKKVQTLLSGAGALHTGVEARKGATRQKIVDLTKALVGDAGEDVQLRFSRLVYEGSEHADRPPKLAGGVLVKTGDKYLFCAMPACDAERVPASGVAFPFLPAEIDGKGVSVVVRSPGTSALTRFSIEPKIANLSTRRFASMGGNGPVLASKEGDAYKFADQDGNQYEYVARLRPLVTQQILVTLGAAMSRVGLMESEYARQKQ